MTRAYQGTNIKKGAKKTGKNFIKTIPVQDRDYKPTIRERQLLSLSKTHLGLKGEDTHIGVGKMVKKKFGFGQFAKGCCPCLNKDKLRFDNGITVWNRTFK